MEYTYTDPGGPAQQVYTVVPSPQIGFPVKSVLIHVRRNRQTENVTLCEVYAFGATFLGHVMRRGKLEHLVTTGTFEGKRGRGRQRDR
ncbi:hypothetical protein PoB_006254300 [Plakobranchus ocellatus]|uniref:Uncharacterized protein n=1 Tax=Plakobranchus ocellatus TaxID=259542 RepID=A0AAV4CVZ1_9GAST|nr:hypothetical protein PoB_006254300 [Plakobranchus ocellatus]